MSCLNLKVPTQGKNPIDYLNAVSLQLDNKTNSSYTGLNCIFEIGVLNNPMDIISLNGTVVYPATSSTDTSISGKTALTQIPVSATTSSKFYLFVLPSTAVIDTIYFVPSGSGACIHKFSANTGSTQQAISTFLDITYLPLGAGFFKARSIYPTRYALSVSDLINSEMIIDMFGMGSYSTISGTFTTTHRDLVISKASTTGFSFSMQWGISDLTLDLVNVPPSLTYIELTKVSGTPVITCSSTSVPFISSKTTQLYVNIGVTMDSTSIDNLLIACAARTSLSSSSFLFAKITLKGTRTSASDSAVTTLNAAGITVTINA